MGSELLPHPWSFPLFQTSGSTVRKQSWHKNTHFFLQCLFFVTLALQSTHCREGQVRFWWNRSRNSTLLGVEEGKIKAGPCLLCITCNIRHGCTHTAFAHTDIYIYFRKVPTNQWASKKSEYEPVHEARNQSKTCKKFLRGLGSFINYSSMKMHHSEIKLKTDRALTDRLQLFTSASPSGRPPLYPNAVSQNRILATKGLLQRFPFNSLKFQTPVNFLIPHRNPVNSAKQVINPGKRQ